MTPSDLDHLEKSLTVRLPDAYRSAMLTYPFPLDSQAAEFWLHDAAAATLTTNLQIREANPSLNGAPWPHHLIVIGSDGGEEMYLLDCATAPYAVVVYEIETGRTRLCAASFEEYLEKQFADLRADEEDRRAMTDAYKNRKWWQFWIRPYPSDNRES